jgi:hypothetical protein
MAVIGMKMSNPQTIFQKLSSNAAQIGRKLSTNTCNALNNLASISKTLSVNPIVNRLTGEKGRTILNGLSNLAKDTSDLTNYRGFKGDFNNVSKTILEKRIK